MTVPETPRLLPDLWKWTLASGLLAVILGILVLAWPGISGLANTAIAAALSVGVAGVGQRVARPVRRGRAGQVRAGPRGPGSKQAIPQEKIDEIVDLTLNYRPAGETHWSCRTMAAATGVSKSTVQQVWSARGLKPHRVQTFKLSNDPKFEEKLVDVVGLYLNPPEKAIVLCADEKSSVQALDRTQASRC